MKVKLPFKLTAATTGTLISVSEDKKTATVQLSKEIISELEIVEVGDLEASVGKKVKISPEGVVEVAASTSDTTGRSRSGCSSKEGLETL